MRLTPTLFLIATLVAFGLASSACDDDPVGASDVIDEQTDVVDDSVARDIVIDSADTGDDTTDLTDAEDVAEDTFEVSEDLILDIDVAEIPEGFFPDDPTGPCIEGGDGARGRLTFSDGEPLANATVSILFDDQKHLGVSDENGQFYIQAPCDELMVEVGIFESENYPTHPSLWNMPVGSFDAATEEPTFEIPLVAVEGLIVDVERQPIPGAIVIAQLEHGRIAVLNTQEADELGLFSVNLVPWPRKAYDLTAEGPLDSDKRYRSATLSILIGDPPPDPTTFTLFEDRCPITGTFHTSEGTALEWLRVYADGEPYPDGSVAYYSFERGVYYNPRNRDVVLDEVPLFCGIQSLDLTVGYWMNPDWPCRDPANTDQPCIHNFPLWADEEITEPQPDGVEVGVVRLSGTITDELGLPAPDVIVEVEGYGRRFEQNWSSSNSAITNDEGYYSVVVIGQQPDEDAPNYSLHARIRDDDRRPLGEYTGNVEVIGDTTLDITLPEAPPRCIVSGTVHSSEGTVFNEVELYFYGYDTETGASLYENPPWDFFTEEPEIYYRMGFPEEEIPFIPFLCGDHRLYLNSADWPSCNSSPDQICFKSWRWWPNFGDGLLEEPRTDGIEIPVVHLSGQVTTSEGVPVAGAQVIAMSGSFSFVQNATGTGPDGIYDLVVIPGLTYQVDVSVGDDHELNPCEADGEVCKLLAVSDTVTVDGATELNFVMPPAPVQCPYSGTVKTSDNVVLEGIDYVHFGVHYGSGWAFRSMAPGEFFRCVLFFGMVVCPPEPTLIMDHIPLYCGVQPDHDPSEWTQELTLNSFLSTWQPSCYDLNNYDQPCLSNFLWDEELMLTEPMTDDLVIPVVSITGTVSLSDGRPIQGADVEVSGSACIARDEEEVCIRGGGISNQTRTRPDGRYQLDVVPEATAEYTITITTPLSVDLGSITYIEVINADTTVDASFSLTE